MENYVSDYLDSDVKNQEIFCDSAGGQNTNYTVIRPICCHYLVYTVKRLESIRITFSRRGHSYTKVDKDFEFVKTKTKTELPNDWIEVFKSARWESILFQVVDLSVIQEW